MPPPHKNRGPALNAMAPVRTANYDPRLDYRRRLEARRGTVDRCDALHVRLGYLKIAFLLLLLVAGAFTLSRGATSGRWLLLPCVLFVVTSVIHARVIENLRRAAQAIAHYESGLARIEDRWIGKGDSTGHPATDESHPYAADLDLFGRGSLFELLCTARTRAGQETLARWLREPAAPTEILARQDAVRELRMRIDLREALAVLGAQESSPIRLESLLAWGAAPRVFASDGPRAVAALSTALLLTALAAALYLGVALAWLALCAALSLAALVGLVYRARVRTVLEQAQGFRCELLRLSRLLARAEREALESPKLLSLRSAMGGGVSPARQIEQLDRLLGLCDLKRIDVPAALVVLWQWRLLVLPFSFALWSTQLAFAIDSWRVRNGPAVGRWAELAGEFDALCAIAGYAYEHPLDPFPEIVATGPLFHGEDLRHPLIPGDHCVPNSVRVDSELQILVVSGSNMSGKSTLLRTVGVNTVLALAGAPVRATRLRLSPLVIGATIRTQDSIQGGTSRFYAEIGRIRRMVESAERGHHVLFLLDELLHGTSSHDRAVGAAAIVRALIRRGGIGLITTHDLALARLEDILRPRAQNVHFRDAVRDGRMIFDYRLHRGIVPKSNALELMIGIGLEIDESLVDGS
jgi:hypothetical protein